MDGHKLQELHVSQQQESDKAIASCTIEQAVICLLWQYQFYRDLPYYIPWQGMGLELHLRPHKQDTRHIYEPKLLLNQLAANSYGT